MMVDNCNNLNYSPQANLNHQIEPTFLIEMSNQQVPASALRWIFRKLALSGRFRRSDLAKQFFVSDITANRWIRSAGLSAREPGEIPFSYDPRLKLYSPSKPLSQNLDVSRLLDEEGAFSLLRGRPPLDGNFVDATPLFSAPDHSRWTLAIAEAIASKTALRISYASKQRLEEWVISPHRIIRIESRRHARCYCHDLRRFIDIVPSRIIDCSSSDADYVDGFDDFEWHRDFIEIVFGLNPDLSSEEIAAAKLEWGWSPGCGDMLSVHSRVALSYYAEMSISRRGTISANFFRPWFILMTKRHSSERLERISWISA